MPKKKTDTLPVPVIGIDQALTRPEKISLTAENLVASLLSSMQIERALVRVNLIQAIFKRAEEELRAQALPLVQAVAASGAEPYLEADGMRIGLTTTPAAWDYGTDAELVAMEKRVWTIKTQIKARQELLESLQEDIIDTATGEVTGQKPKTVKIDGYTVTGATKIPRRETISIREMK